MTAKISLSFAPASLACLFSVDALLQGATAGWRAIGAGSRAGGGLCGEHRKR
jgi:hypothetical protein